MKYLQKVLLALAIGFSLTLSAQEVAIKTNVLYDATTTPNLTLELGTTSKQTIQLMYSLNPWKFSDSKQFRHWLLSPEYRWWFCHRFNGSFLGVHALGGQYNIKGIKAPFGIWPDMKDYRYEGWLVGGGITYGYQWILSKHWNIEASIGVGYLRVNYKKFTCDECSEELEHPKTNYVGPTKAAISLVYLF